ncbi:MAG: hypothetical protein GY850_01495 [bacterium]|nr:hypothetical protein [bacterium]
MEKEMGTAGEIVKADVSGGFDRYKEAVFNALGNFFTWLSTHQGLAIVIILGILAIMIYLIVRFRKYSKQTAKKAAGQKIEIGKKDALIEEQKNKLVALQSKLSNQQQVVSQALIGTITSLTGYNIDQLQTFFKFLTEMSGSPLQIADTQANTLAGTRRLEEEGYDSAEENAGDEKIDQSTVPEEVVVADKDEKITPGAGPEEAAETDKSRKE